MGADEAANLDALIGRREILDRLIATHGGRMAAARTSWLKRPIFMWIGTAVVLLVSIGGTAAQPKSGETAAQTKKIVVLHSYDRNFEPGAAWSREIRNELSRQSPWPLEIQEQSLAMPQDGNGTAEAKFAEYLGALYARRPPDLIVAIGAPAARFVQRHRTDLYPTTPMLLAAVELRRVDQSMLSEQDTVVGVRFDQVALVENILRLLPETKAIAIIIGNSPNERFWVEEQQRILGPLLKNKVEFDLLQRAAVRRNFEGSCKFAAPQCDLLSAAMGGRCW
jgi:hypothetical protein